jgi:hypothetical protein
VAPTNILQILTKAIKERRCVALRYKDQRSVHVIEPHAIYSDEDSQLIPDSCFSAARLKYKSGLVAIVEVPSPPFAYPEATSEMGPPRPEHLRRPA